MTRQENKIIDMMAGAYIKVLGIEKWNSLTDKEKHDVVMILVKDTLNALDRI